MLKSAVPLRFGAANTSRVHRHLRQRAIGQPLTQGAKRRAQAFMRRSSATTAPKCAAGDSQIALEESGGKDLQDDFAAEESTLEASRVATEAGSRKKWAEAFAQKLGMEVVVPKKGGGGEKISGNSQGGGGEEDIGDSRGRGWNEKIAGIAEGRR
ncbi:hypothetical protein CYMTET_49888 [Cymbomonas tetramitiformis]|uniref:Uncharacterized protein n=1 Tax=Cymbomonas tetramitiformis TaxID=36881 RepID=A0AAE0ETF4_9CHLO|nr:hypothetical protein CYMTET_49888 [Cymbomonas tetramitiformis]